MSIRNKLPPLNFKDNETGCCPRFDPKPWDEKTFIFDKKLFVKARTINFFHIPLNMGKMVTKTWEKIKKASADDPNEFVILSCDPSPWRGDHYFTVTKEVPGVDNVRLSGTYLTKVFEGPYKEVGKWVAAMKDYVATKEKKLKKLYFYYTTCPKCANHYGKNYIVAFAEI